MDGEAGLDSPCVEHGVQLTLVRSVGGLDEGCAEVVVEAVQILGVALPLLQPIAPVNVAADTSLVPAWTSGWLCAGRVSTNAWRSGRSAGTSATSLLPSLSAVSLSVGQSDPSCIGLILVPARGAFRSGGPGGTSVSYSTPGDNAAVAPPGTPARAAWRCTVQRLPHPATRGHRNAPQHLQSRRRANDALRCSPWPRGALAGVRLPYTVLSPVPAIAASGPPCERGVFSPTRRGSMVRGSTASPGAPSW